MEDIILNQICIEIEDKIPFAIHNDGNGNNFLVYDAISIGQQTGFPVKRYYETPEKVIIEYGFGFMIYNSGINPKVYDQSLKDAINELFSINANFIQATGGNITFDGDYKIHTFTGDGTFEVLSVNDSNIDILVIGAGGGGGSDGSSALAGGGGGAGELVYSTDHAISVGNWPIVIGSGGVAGYGSYPQIQTIGGIGSSSTFLDLIAIGGGGGGCYLTNATNGASGGGGTNSSTKGLGTIGKGNDGGSKSGGGDGYGGGGGGGAGTAGSDSSNPNAGNGGNGLNNSITGSSVYYCGGGGGGASYLASLPGNGGLGGGGNGGNNSNVSLIGSQDGQNNTGGGGGGGGYNTGYDGSLRTASKGGSGVIIIRYKYK